MQNRKYTVEFKEQALELAKTVSAKKAAEQLGICKHLQMEEEIRNEGWMNPGHRAQGAPRGAGSTPASKCGTTEGDVKLFTEEFKKAAVQKYLSRGSGTVAEICTELGVANPTLCEWARKYGITP